MQEPPVLFVRVTLARAAACECCASALSRGARAHLVVDPSRRSRPLAHVRCTGCFDAGKEPAVNDVLPPEAAAPLATTMGAAAFTRLHGGALALAAIAIGVVAILATRTARRLFVTLGVAIKVGARALW